jgi:ABC-2 type transport system ATP-binding protein
MLEVKNLVKLYKNVVAVDGISFKVEPGKIFGLLGPNGAGKTTTMRMILNIIKPTKGEIIFEDKISNEDFLNNIGYLPEERGLYRKSKVIDLLLYFASLKNMNKFNAKFEAAKWMRKLGINDLANRKIEELSKGNQQKIQFISSVLHNPKILVLDEPFTGFDPINQQEIKNYILEFVSTGRILILSTHQMDTAEKLCSEIFLINKGKEICSGELSEIKRKFGGNHIRIGFDGDIQFLNHNPKVFHQEIYNNYVDVQLNNDTNPHEFLKSIVDKITITHFSVIEPSLNKIFIDKVNHSLTL